MGIIEIVFKAVSDVKMSYVVLYWQKPFLILNEWLNCKMAGAGALGRKNEAEPTSDVLRLYPSTVECVDTTVYLSIASLIAREGLSVTFFIVKTQQFNQTIKHIVQE